MKSAAILCWPTNLKLEIMAEIKIEKKKPILPWILLFLGVLALIYFLVIKDTENDPMLDNNNHVDTLDIRDTSQSSFSESTFFIA